MASQLAQNTGSFFGKITPPKDLEIYGESGGLIKFGNNLIVFAVIVGGILSLVNIVHAGFIYLTSGGDTKAHEKVIGKITMSLWGLAIMILAPAIMAIFGFLLFKDATYFLQPQLQGVN